MKPTLKNQPESYTFQDLKAKFAEGKPLSVDQLNFLAGHEKSLSNPLMDSINKYYLKHKHHPYLDEHSFLLPSEVMNKETIKKLKRRLHMLLQQKTKNVILKFTPQQFHELKNLAYGELILYHGNQFVTGAPFFPGGIPHVIFFQWGNLFGVAKYVVLPEEKSLKSNVLIHFEDMADRLINECVENYNHKENENLNPTQQLAPEYKASESNYHAPKMGLSISNEEHEDK